MAAVRFAAGVTATSDFPTIAAACAAAERGGFDAFTRPDHLLAEGTLGAPSGTLHECFTTLAALAARTTRIRFVPVVACNSFRHPPLLARMVASLDVLSGGRMELGIGAGWHRREYEAYGFPFPPMPERLARLREAIRIVKRLWTGDPVDHHGPHYRLRAARCTPIPLQTPRPPILVGGGGSGLLAIAAAEADVVNVVPPASHGAADPEEVRRFTLERFKKKAATVRRLAAEAGRDPASLTLSAIFFVQLTEDPQVTRQAHEAIAARYKLSLPDAERFPLMFAGTPTDLGERIAERLHALDVRYAILNFATPDAIERFGREVLPALQRH
jgi:probable F420-dependent oxidoreductase